MATIEKRISGNGSVAYRVKVRLQGEKPRTKTFRRLTDAKAWAAAAEADLGRGLHVPTAIERRRTVGQLIEAYVEECLPFRKLRDERRQRQILARWKERAGHLALDRLDSAAVGKFRADVARRVTEEGKPISGATVNRELAALSAVCKWGWKEKRWLRENPVLAVSKAAESTGVVRFLSDDERKRLLTQCEAESDTNIAAAVVLALATGARYSNIRQLRWEDVDLVRMRLVFRDTKNGDPRAMPIVGAAQRFLRLLRDRDPTGTSWVFKGHRDDAPADLEKAWRGLRARARLENFRFHDLRHTAASYLTMNGATLAEVADALGHRTLVMAKRYSHQSGEHMRNTLERMAGAFNL